jgi:hypothetical protein
MAMDGMEFINDIMHISRPCASSVCSALSFLHYLLVSNGYSYEEAVVKYSVISRIA